jgi:acyl-CoA thioesterase FadM
MPVCLGILDTNRCLAGANVKPPHLTSEQIRELGPPCYETVARAEWTDRNEHVNIRYLVAVFDDAGDAFYPSVGLGDASHRSRESGTMDLEHHTNFLREVRTGDRLAVYLRIVAVSPKRFHYLMFLVNLSTGELASIFECVNTFVDLTLRKSAPWPDDVRHALVSLVERHRTMSWPAPVCGSMSA